MNWLLIERILYFHLDSTTFANLRQIFSKHIEQYIYSTLETKKTPPSKESDVTTPKKYPHSVLHRYRLHKTNWYGHQL